MFENENLLMAKMIVNNIKSDLDDQMSLSKTEENYVPVKKGKSHAKALVLWFTGIIFAGICLSAILANDAHTYNIINSTNII